MLGLSLKLGALKCRRYISTAVYVLVGACHTHFFPITSALAAFASCRRARIRRRMSFMRLLYALRNNVARTRDGITARIAYIPRAPWTSRPFTVFNYSKTGRPRCSIYVGV